MDAEERYFGKNSFDWIFIPFLLSSSLSIWLIEAIFSEAMEFHVDSRIDKAGFIYEGPSKSHFSKVAINNATGIFRYHKVAFVSEASYEIFWTSYSSYEVANFIEV
nr:hypothetical protein [Tanacetum cinerariifolium]